MPSKNSCTSSHSYHQGMKITVSTISSTLDLTNVLFFILMWTIFKDFFEFVTILLLFYILVFWHQVMQDLSFPTRDQTHTPCIGKWSLNHWAAVTRVRALCSLQDRPINLRDQGLRQGIQLYLESYCLKRTILLGPGCQVLLWIRDGGRWGNKVKRPFTPLGDILQIKSRMASLRQEDVLLSLPYSHFTGDVKCSIFYHINKQRCHIYLRFRLPQMWISEPCQ